MNSDLEQALRIAKMWAQVVMNDSKHNSGQYRNAKDDRDWCELVLRSIR
jgi:hypothetical protein